MDLNNYSNRFSKENIFFSILLLGTLSYFLFWASDYTHGNYPSILILATLFGVFMAFNIGGNDVANSFGTSVGAGTLTIKQALIIAAIFEVSGALIAGGEVTNTIRKGIVDLNSMAIKPMEFVSIMMSALLAAGIWLLIATKKGLPVSTTHSIIGSIVGASITLGIVLDNGVNAFSLVHWEKIGTIALSWVLSPLMGGLLAYFTFGLIKKSILDYNQNATENLKQISIEKKKLNEDLMKSFQAMDSNEKVDSLSNIIFDIHASQDEDLKSDNFLSNYYQKKADLEDKKNSINSHHAMQTYLPIIAALSSMILTGMVIFKGLKHIELSFSTLENYLIMGMIATLTWVSVYLITKIMSNKNLERSTFILFSWFQVFTAAGFAFSHGSNDIANAIGPFAAIIDILRSNELHSSATVPKIAMLTFGAAMIVGLWFIGKHVIKTVGYSLTNIHPASGFSAELSAATVVLLASTFGIPVSSTHILIGAVLGIGIVNSNANWSLMKPIGLAWIITLPAAAILASMIFLSLRYFL